jgi:hypothetical protein
VVISSSTVSGATSASCSLITSAHRTNSGGGGISPRAFVIQAPFLRNSVDIERCAVGTAR